MQHACHGHIDHIAHIDFDDPADAPFNLYMAMLGTPSSSVDESTETPEQVHGDAALPENEAPDAELEYPPDTPPDETKSNLNFLVTMWEFECKFLANHKEKHPNTVTSEETRLQIKFDAFSAASMTLSHRTASTLPHPSDTKTKIKKAPSEVTARDLSRAARRTLEHFKVLKKARRSLAARLLA
jgi:hypothetical protein